MNEVEHCDMRRTAIAEMLTRAEQLEREAKQWRQLATALDEINKHAESENGRTESDTVPSIGNGSAAEELLWRLATFSKWR